MNAAVIAAVGMMATMGDRAILSPLWDPLPTPGRVAGLDVVQLDEHGLVGGSIAGDGATRAAGGRRDQPQPAR